MGTIGGKSPANQLQQGAEAERGRTTEQRWDDCKLNSLLPFSSLTTAAASRPAANQGCEGKNLCSRLSPMRSEEALTLLNRTLPSRNLLYRKELNRT